MTCLALPAIAFLGCQITLRSRSPSPSPRHLLWSIPDDANEANEANDPATVCCLIQWDGGLVDTTAWRIQTGIQAACTTWPEQVPETTAASSSDWLRNKLAALTHVLHPPPHYDPIVVPITNTDDTSTSTSATAKATFYSATCEYALAVRLLLEEQRLDQGRSDGRTGKYASRFHPDGNDTTIEQSQSQSQKLPQQSQRRQQQRQGSRPLTVGEIAANWKEGGMLRETLATKYHVQFQNPLPIVQNCVDQITLAQPTDSMDYYTTILDSLLNSKVPCIVSVNHVSDLLPAKESLDKMLQDGGNSETSVQIVTTTQEAVNLLNTQRPLPSLKHIPILVRSTTSARQLLEETPKGTTLYILDSSLDSLQSEIPLLGDNIPRARLDTASIVEGRKIGLLYPQWSVTTQQNPSLHATATMNPWIHLVDTDDFVKVLK